MSADMKIHVLVGATEADLAAFCSSTLGSKYFNMYKIPANWSDYYEIISNTPGVWVGEVSWLKAAISEDSDEFIPDPVGAISDLFDGGLVEITDDLIDKVKAALGLDNTTQYEVTDGKDVIAFLEQYKGKQAFTISW